MFFRYHKPKVDSFDERMERTRAAGFAVTNQGPHTRVSRDGVAAEIEKDPDGLPRVAVRAGLVMNGEIATLVDGGFQKFFETPSHTRKPAVAKDLRAVHLFQEDLREALGLTSLYNESLGTTSTAYLYDRVEDRDTGGHPQPWKVKTE
jgi:hypothetical protein